VSGRNVQEGSLRLVGVKYKKEISGKKRGNLLRGRGPGGGDQLF
jgi:hypothetical protein